LESRSFPVNDDVNYDLLEKNGLVWAQVTLSLNLRQQGEIKKARYNHTIRYANRAAAEGAYAEQR
jgi:hypothetical protein